MHITISHTSANLNFYHSFCVIYPGKPEVVSLKPVFIVIFPYKRVRRFCCIHENRTFYKRISLFHFRD